MTVTVHGTYLRADDNTPSRGVVQFIPSIVAVHDEPDPAHVVVQSAVSGQLDENGTFTVALLASDDPGWRTDGDMPYLVRCMVDGLSATYSVVIYGPGPVDIADLLPLSEPPAVQVVPVPGPAGPQGPPGPPGPPGADSTVPGPTAVSADAGNRATLGSDSLTYVPDDTWRRWAGTQAEYNAITTKDPNTLYVITG